MSVLRTICKVLAANWNTSKSTSESTVPMGNFDRSNKKE